MELSSNKRIGFITILVAVVAVIYSGTRGHKLKAFETFQSDEGRFSILFPGKPKRRLNAFSAPAGKVKSVMFNSGSRRVKFVAGYADFPQEAVEDAGSEEVVDWFKDYLLKGGRLRLTGETKMDFHGYAGRELRMRRTGRKGYIRWRTILIENRLYYMMVWSKSVEIMNEDGGEFFDSFSVEEVG